MSPDSKDRPKSQHEAPTISTIGSPGADSTGCSSDPSSDGGEFPPGHLIAGRFRIIGQIGSGGMGDVYRADDHELGQSVALKFLPAELAGDPVRLERLRNEVRLARQISHPNVCRVYDIGDADGRPFLSMEYIDGEDLASLLRRIGRLPGDKAIELAREICAGVGAAHELGVVHRDLKPANVMIDGRGRARVADFGLARTTADLGDGRDAQAGTPAYMAPEQLQGADATNKTDIYALGLVLYELFTGKRAHDAKTIADLRERYSSSAPPTSPSDLVEGMDPVVERVIMHCLENNPEDRPATALSVMAALPGGDPLAAMLKAGEMPSPELVAASGRRGTLSMQRALQLCAIVVLSTAASLWLFGVPSLEERIGVVLAPEVLAHQARTLLEDIGYEFDTVDSASGFDLDPDIVSQLASASTAEKPALLQSDERPVLRFWYRSSPAPMAPWRSSLPGLYVGNRVAPDDPPLTDVGMALFRLGPRGALLELRLVPDPSLPESDKRQADVIASIAEAAGLDPVLIEPVEWTGISPMPGDTTSAWHIRSDEIETNNRVIIATFAGGRPTWARITSTPETDDYTRRARGQDRVILVFFVFFILGAVVAVYNARSGRWDRRGATRLAASVFILCFSSSIIGSHHSLTAGDEVRGFFSSVAYGATRALMTWLLYVAIEPFIRRLRPSSLVSWSRLLSGRIFDPAVGRDVLIGIAVLALQGIALALSILAFGLRESGVPTFAFASGENPLALAQYVAAVVRLPAVMLGTCLGFMLIYVVSRSLIGRLKFVSVGVLWTAIFLFMFGAYTATGQPALVLAIFASISASASTYLAIRHGLLAYATFIFMSQVWMYTVVSLDPTDWYFPPTAILLILTAALTIFGIMTSIDRKTLMSHS